MFIHIVDLKRYMEGGENFISNSCCMAFGDDVMASHLFQTAEKTFPRIWNFFHGHEQSPALPGRLQRIFFGIWRK